MHSSAVQAVSCVIPPAVSCPGWPWCVGAPGALEKPCPACWPRGAAGWLLSPGMKMLPAPRWLLCVEVEEPVKHYWCFVLHTVSMKFKLLKLLHPHILNFAEMQYSQCAPGLLPTLYLNIKQRKCRPPCSQTVCIWALVDHMALSCDVSKEQEVQKTFQTIQKTCGNISYLVNAAGINR